MASNYDKKIIVEKCLTDHREINVAVLGDQDDLKVSACEEPITAEDILTYGDKYVGSSKTKMASQENQKKNFLQICQKKCIIKSANWLKNHLRQLMQQEFQE